MSRFVDADRIDWRLIIPTNATTAEEHIIYRARKLVESQPTADVVEVVRCKDCEYMCHYTDGHLECRLLSDLKPIPTTYCTMNEDDFCSYGERREDAEIH